ncbi:MAG TPA: hypothetical protein VF553_16470 [Pyrinomonadaceae bacterium]|jgi:hypothetical protein
MESRQRQLARGEILVHRVNAVRAAQDYAMLSGYGEMPSVHAPRDAHEYTDEEFFWRDVLNSGPNTAAVKTVRLRAFGLSRWVPRVPGLYWKDSAQQLRQRARQYKLPVQVMQPDSEGNARPGAIFSPTGKTLRLLGGVGNVRLLPTISGSLLVASSSGKYWQGVPVLLRSDVWQQLGNVEEGTVADILGTWTPMPRDVAQGLGGEAGIPRYCLVVSEARDIQLRPGAQMSGLSSAWTLFERRDAQTNLSQLDFAYCLFRANGAASPSTSIKGLLEEDAAGDWLRAYVDEFNGRALTDYDEEMPRLDPLLPINELMSRDIRPGRLRAFIDEVKQQALSPEVLNYDELPGLLVKHFSTEDLTALALDYLSLELENLIGQVAGKAELVTALIDYCREQRRLPELIVGVVRERPHLSLALAAPQ